MFRSQGFNIQTERSKGVMRKKRGGYANFALPTQELPNHQSLMVIKLQKEDIVEAFDKGGYIVNVSQSVASAVIFDRSCISSRFHSLRKVQTLIHCLLSLYKIWVGVTFFFYNFKRFRPTQQIYQTPEEIENL